MIMINCGYTWEYINNHMTLPKLAAITKYMTLKGKPEPTEGAKLAEARLLAASARGAHVR